MQELYIIIIFFTLTILIIILTEIQERKNKQKGKESVNNNCCGTHLICEKANRNVVHQIEYFDDEDLDILAFVDPQNYTNEQHDLIYNIFSTIPSTELEDWCRSLQMRNICLPPDLYDEVLLIIKDLRNRDKA